MWRALHSPIHIGRIGDLIRCTAVGMKGSPQLTFLIWNNLFYMNGVQEYICCTVYKARVGLYYGRYPDFYLVLFTSLFVFVLQITGYIDSCCWQKEIHLMRIAMMFFLLLPTVLFATLSTSSLQIVPPPPP